MEIDMSVIGLDVGRSAVKVAVEGQHLIFPTAACPAIEVSQKESAAAAAADTVLIDGERYFVGQTALIHTAGRVPEALSDGWLESKEHAALLKSAYDRACAIAGHEKAPTVVLGLPSRLLRTQQERLIELARMHLRLDSKQVLVLPQPLGAFFAAKLDDNGYPLEQSPQGSTWGIVDIGYFTADYGLISDGTWSTAGEKSSPGANVMAQDLREAIIREHGVQLQLRVCDEILRARATKIMGKPTDLGALVDEVVARYARGVIEIGEQVFGPTLPTLDGVLIAGGGADLVIPHVKKAWPHSHSVSEPRFAVAEGMRRYGLLRTAQASVSKAA